MEIGNDRIFRVRWGKGYAETEPRIVTMKEIEESNDWNLDDGFISNLKTVRIQDEFDYDLKWVDPSGEVFFKGISEDTLETILLNHRFNLEYTGGGCTCFTSKIDTDHWIMVTDGDAGTDFEGQVWIGLYRGNPFENQEIMHMTAELDLTIAHGIDDTIRLLSYFQPKLREWFQKKENS